MPAATGAESISIAIDSATTHLYEPGTRIPMESALKLGATLAGIIAVMTLTSGCILWHSWCRLCSRN